MSKKPKQKTWREVLPVHPAAEIFPLMSTKELGELADDIAKHGLREPVVIWREDNDAPLTLLDGRNRLAALELLGCEIFHSKTKKGEIDWFHRTSISNGLSFQVFQIKCYEDPIAYVVSRNIRRRHLDADQKRDLITKLLKLDPAKSDRAIAATVGVDHKTAGKVRRKAEARGDIPHVEKRSDTKGRKQPVRRKKAPAAKTKGKGGKVLLALPPPGLPELASANPDAKVAGDAPTPARDPKTGELSAEANAANAISRALAGFHSAFEAQLKAWLETQPTQEGLEVVQNTLGLIAEELYRMRADVLAQIGTEAEESKTKAMSPPELIEAIKSDPRRLQHAGRVKDAEAKLKSPTATKAEADNATPADVAGEMMKAKFAATDDLTIPPRLRRLH